MSSIVDIRLSGIAIRSFAGVLANTIPRSSRKVRNWLITAVRRDAEAIAEAVERRNMRFVPIKTDDQLDLQAIHRVRDRLIA